MKAHVSSLVIGGSGFIGRYLVERLLAAGQDVRTLDLGPSAISHPRLTHWSGSFLQSELLDESLTGVDCVYHLAATAMPREANLNPRRDSQENVLGTLGILDAAIVRNVRRLIFISSGGTVYGPTDQVPIPETHSTNPINAYGVSKLACEKYLRLYNGRGTDIPLSTISLRVANPYGPRQNTRKAQGALTTFAFQAVQGERIQIWGDGSVERDFIHVRDVARAIELAGRSDVSGTEINIGSGKGTSLNDLLTMIERALGRPVPRDYRPARSFDVPRNFLDIAKAKRELDWTPEIGLQGGISELIAHFQSAAD